MSDLKFACRQLLKNPGFTVVAVLTLAVGIGATTAIFSLVDAVLIKALPVRNPEKMVVLDVFNQLLTCLYFMTVLPACERFIGKRRGKIHGQRQEAGPPE